MRAALLTGDTAGRRRLGRARRGARRSCRSRSRSRCGRGRSCASPRATPTRAVALALESVATHRRGSGSPSSPRAGASSPGARSPRSATATPRPSSCAPPKGLLVDAPAGHLRAEAVRELRRIGRRVNRAGRAGRADAAGSAALTARELEIAQLVAGGLTNRAVAEDVVPEREDDREPPRRRVRQARRAHPHGARRRAGLHPLNERGRRTWSTRCGSITCSCAWTGGCSRSSPTGPTTSTACTSD